MLQVYAGFPSVAGWPGGRPLVVGTTPPDFIAPVLGAVAVIAALEYRDRTGKGQFIDLSELETAILGFAPAMLDYAVNGRIATAVGNSCPYAAPHNAYRCKGDNRWCAIAVFTDEEWKALCDVIDNPEWTKEARFQTLLGRKENEAALDQLIEEWTVGYTAEEIMAKMQKGGVAAGVVQNVKDVVEHCPQVKHRHLFWTLGHSEIGPQPYMSLASVLSKTPRELKKAAPLMGEHTEHVCKELLGMSEEKYVGYLLDGVFE